MFQKETIPISFEEEYSDIRYAFRAHNDTLVFPMKQQQTE